MQEQTRRLQPPGGKHEALRQRPEARAVVVGLGLAMVALAFLGTLPLSRSMTRNLASLTEGPPDEVLNNPEVVSAYLGRRYAETARA